MSVHLAKAAAAAASATSAGGGGGGGNEKVGANTAQNRRTPLSLSGAGKVPVNKTAGSSAGVLNQTTDKNDNKGEKSAVVNKDVEMKKQSSSKGDGETNVPKKDEKSTQENGYTNGHKRNDSKGDDKKMNTSETITNAEKKDTIPVRESQRNKEKQQQHHKEDKESPRKSESTKSNEKSINKKNEKDKEKTSEEGENNKKKSSTEKENNKKDISIESVSVKKATDEKLSQDSGTESSNTIQKDEKKSQESSKVEDKKKQEPVVIQEEKKSQESMIETSKSPTVQNESPIADEKDDMEPLVFEGEGETPGQPGASSTPGKVLKHREGPLYGEQIKQKTDASSTLETSTASRRTASYDYSLPITRPGRISGRRSIRNLPEISFENRYPGYYRPIPDDDRWSSSMNVTVGSEIQNESTSSSFSFFSRGKKRERTPTQSSQPVDQAVENQDSELSPKSPKRARLDFSGFLGMMASPMTMLRAKFSRAKIQSSSTPNGKLKNKRNNDTDATNEGGNIGHDEDVVNVSGVISEDVTAVLDADGNDIVDGDNDEDDVSIGEEGKENEEIETNKNPANLQDTDNNDDIIIKEKLLKTSSNESVNKRKMCNVM